MKKVILEPLFPLLWSETSSIIIKVAGDNIKISNIKKYISVNIDNTKQAIKNNSIIRKTAIFLFILFPHISTFYISENQKYFLKGLPFHLVSLNVFAIFLNYIL